MERRAWTKEQAWSTMVTAQAVVAFSGGTSSKTRCIAGTPGFSGSCDVTATVSTLKEGELADWSDAGARVRLSAYGRCLLRHRRTPRKPCLA